MNCGQQTYEKYPDHLAIRKMPIKSTVRVHSSEIGYHTEIRNQYMLAKMWQIVLYEKNLQNFINTH